MDFQFPTITMPVAALMASLIGASATITAALLQLRIAWRKELKARERGQPVTSKSRRGPIVAVLVLLIASAIGGFALSQYLVTERHRAADRLRAEFDGRLDQLNATARRLEQITLQRPGEVATATLLLEPCVACSEQAPLQLTLCARIPATAAVNAIELYARSAESPHRWQEGRIEPGEDIGGGRLAGKPFERLDGDDGKQVCQGVLHWNGTQGRSVHLLVRHGAGGTPEKVTATHNGGE